MLRNIWTSLLAASLVSAMMTGDESTGPDNSSTPTTTAGEITIHHITVGHVMHAFQPNSVQVKSGDIVQFTFHSGNHSIIRAQYGYPCIPYENVNQNSQGFYSGVVPVNDSGTLPTWRMTINNTDPVFFYGGSPKSCYAFGMVGVINANNGTDLSRQIALAKQEQYQLLPGETMPAAAIHSLASIAATATAIPSSKASGSSSEPISATPGTLSSSIIAAIVVGSLVLVTGIAALFFFLGRARRRRNSLREQHWHVQANRPGKPESMGGPQYTQPPFEQNRQVVSPISPQPPLPSYAATTGLKSPGTEQVAYLGTQQYQTPSHIIYTEHSGFTDTQPHTNNPAWPLPRRYSRTSELDAGSTNALRTSPGYGRLQELDAKPLHHPAIDPPKRSDGYM